jgi:hypothetical protein
MIQSNCFTKLNITWAYFDIGRYEGYLFKYINKYHKNGDKSTIVALNMLNGMYYIKITPKSIFFSKCH